MMKRGVGPLLMVIGIFLMSVPIIYLAAEEKMQCDQLIFLEGELSIDIRYVDSYDNGMSTIRLCDGKILRVPTRRIIKIVDKDVQ
jgi:hypothetical protein